MAKCSYLFAVRHEAGSERNEWKHLSAVVAGSAAAVAVAMRYCVCVCTRVCVIASLSLSEPRPRPHSSMSFLDQRKQTKASGGNLTSFAVESL